ncbi:MAG TPA: hypothetical protein VHM25_28075 [Polyangiaceae bacterium]|jgi:hypothetical protein|nr:hypothetical protein [Polyangiaceae bacterium]
MEARSIVRPLFAVLCLAATALGLNNTYGDNADVKALAEKTACGTAPCVVKTLNEHRSAFAQTFGYQTALVEKGKSTQGATVDVECARTYALVGEYECHVKSGGLPQVH